MVSHSFEVNGISDKEAMHEEINDKIKKLDDFKGDGKLFLSLSDIDLVDGTPIIDIKPYLPYADANPDAQAGFAQTAPDSPLAIHFSEQSLSQLTELPAEYQTLQQFIIEVLQQDPRPAYKKSKVDTKVYGIWLDKFNIHWTVSADNKHCEVTNIELA